MSLRQSLRADAMAAMFAVVMVELMVLLIDEV
jgi:hypothetical protein